MRAILVLLAWVLLGCDSIECRDGSQRVVFAGRGCQIEPDATWKCMAECIEERGGFLCRELPSSARVSFRPGPGVACIVPGEELPR